MIVFYDSATGAVTSSMLGKTVPESMQSQPHIILPVDEDLGELQGWSVLENNLALTDLEPFRARAIDRLNRLFGAKRIPLITDIPGQEMIYLRKENEARDYIADPAPDMLNYPMLAAETGVTAPDAYALAQLWLNMSELLRQTAATLERLRMQGINAISVAETPAGIDAVIAFYENALA